LIITNLAGRLTPHAKVLVAIRTYILAYKNISSIIFLSSTDKPAWCIPIPKIIVYFKYSS